MYRAYQFAVDSATIFTINKEVNQDTKMLQEAYKKILKEDRNETKGDDLVIFDEDEVSIAYNNDLYIFGGQVEVQWTMSLYIQATYDHPEEGGDFQIVDAYVVPQVPCHIYSSDLDTVVTPAELGEGVYHILMKMLQKMAIFYAELKVTDKHTGGTDLSRRRRAFQNVFPSKEEQALLDAAEKKDYMNKFSDEVKDAFGDALFNL